MADGFLPLPPPPPPPPPNNNNRNQGGRQQWNGRRGRGHRGGGRHGGRGRGWGRNVNNNNNNNNRFRGGGQQQQQGRGRGRYQNQNSNFRGGRGNSQQQRQQQQPFVASVVQEIGSPSENSLCVAVQGCCHGQLDSIYASLLQHQERTNQKIDVLVCCGDFQSLRNTADFHTYAAPPKYQKLGDFWRYYAGESVAPILTVFIGGNHEASQSLQELCYGGWVAPNIYYMGAAGIVRVGGVRIGGISGIYKSHDFTQGRFEQPPYDRSQLRSVYHVRNTDVFRLQCCMPPSTNSGSSTDDATDENKGDSGNEEERDRIDIMLSHDWPQGIEQHGNTRDLLRRKPFFREEVQRNELGSPANYALLQTLQPKFWFAAHLHVAFQATVHHRSSVTTNESGNSNRPHVTKESKPNPHGGLVPSQLQQPSNETATVSKAKDGEESGTGVEQTTSVDPNTATEQQQPSTTKFHSVESTNGECGVGMSLTDQMTQFLSLDKCLPRRQFLSIVHVPRKEPMKPVQFEYDLEWLAILKKTHSLTIPQRQRVSVPSDFMNVSASDMDWVRTRLAERRQRQEQQQQQELRDELSTKEGDKDPSMLAIPNNFTRTVPCHNDPSVPQFPLGVMGNPQTDDLLDLLGLEHIATVPFVAKPSQAQIPDAQQVSREAVPVPHAEDENEIDLDEEEEDNAARVQTERSTNFKDVADDDEIDIDGDSGDEVIASGKATAVVTKDVADGDEIDIDGDSGDEANTADKSTADITKDVVDGEASTKRARIDDS